MQDSKRFSEAPKIPKKPSTPSTGTSKESMSSPSIEKRPSISNLTAPGDKAHAERKNIQPIGIPKEKEKLKLKDHKDKAHKEAHERVRNLGGCKINF